MDSSDVCPTEDAIQVFLDYLVEPLLPDKVQIQAIPTESEQRSMAKQVHAAVLLYNYYHRIAHPQLKYLGFEPFSRQAVVLKPTLMAFMELTRSEDTELTDLKNQLSLMEKAIMDACNISMSLDALNDATSTKGWPISKVAVLLLDSRKENCYLKFGAVTEGVWSVIEKDVDSSQSTMKVENIGKRKVTPTGSVSDEVSFEQIAFSAVEEAAGINQSELTILESHVVYSLSKEKTAAQFYIICGTKPKNDSCIEISIEDLIHSLQGPLVRKISSHWISSSVLEHFHVLPYARVLCEWLSRERFPNISPDWALGIVVINPNCSERKENPYLPEAHKNKRRCVINSGNIDNNGSMEKGPSNVDVDNPSADCSKNKEAYTCFTDKVQVDSLLKTVRPCAESDLSGTADHAKPNSEDSEEVQSTIASKEHPALQILHRKMEKLILRQREIEDEIAWGSKMIQTIQNGGEDALAVSINSIIKFCDDVFQNSEKEHKSQNLGRKRLSEECPNCQSPCQELDAICHEKKWKLPTYHVSPLDGGFRATVRIKEREFEFSGEGSVRPSPHEARESAAVQVLAKLHGQQSLVC